MTEWTPPKVIGLCPICHDEFYVPHGGKCPAEHEGEAPDLIEYVPEARVEHLLHGICDALDHGKPTEPILRALLKGTEHEGHNDDPEQILNLRSWENDEDYKDGINYWATQTTESS
jgi:hypothetical protein